MKYTLVIECSSEEELKRVAGNLHLLKVGEKKKVDPEVLRDPRRMKEWVEDRKRVLRYTNARLAEEAGVCVGTIYNLLRPQPVSFETLNKVIEILDQ